MHARCTRAAQARNLHTAPQLHRAAVHRPQAMHPGHGRPEPATLLTPVPDAGKPLRLTDLHPSFMPPWAPVVQVSGSVPDLHRTGRLHQVPRYQRRRQERLPGRAKGLPRLQRPQLQDVQPHRQVRGLQLRLPPGQRRVPAHLLRLPLPVLPGRRRQVHQLRRQEWRLLPLPDPRWEVQGGESWVGCLCVVPLSMAACASGVVA